MLERILKLYTMSIATGVTSPLPHLFGPPGTGKSSVVKQAAELLGVNLHTINLSRVSPLELEGVQMPHGQGDDMRLHLLHATFWTQLREGDILLFDEFLRAFPEVMNGLLDIITAREVGGMVLPKVFFIAASNSTIAYDKALEDRLHHIPVPDARKSKAERTRIASLMVDQLGLLPQMAGEMEMDDLISAEILPMYDMLDALEKRSAPAVTKGHSVRNLIGQVQMRDVQSPMLTHMINTNNRLAENQRKFQYVVLLEGSDATSNMQAALESGLVNSPKLAPLQRLNTQLNMQLLELANLDRSSTTDEETT